MTVQKTILEKAITGRQYLEQKGLDPKNYYLSVDGMKAASLDTEIKEGQKVQAIPAISGG
jgi:molybdopterin converting factor small subunit